jgi:hypothetical protein
VTVSYTAAKLVNDLIERGDESDVLVQVDGRWLLVRGVDRQEPYVVLRVAPIGTPTAWREAR